MGNLFLTKNLNFNESTDIWIPSSTTTFRRFSKSLLLNGPIIRYLLVAIFQNDMSYDYTTRFDGQEKRKVVFVIDDGFSWAMVFLSPDILW